MGRPCCGASVFRLRQASRSVYKVHCSARRGRQAHVDLVWFSSSLRRTRSSRRSFCSQHSVILRGPNLRVIPFASFFTHEAAAKTSKPMRSLVSNAIVFLHEFIGHGGGCAHMIELRAGRSLVTYKLPKHPRSFDWRGAGGGGPCWYCIGGGCP
jgi:hypothetical protein